MNKTNKILLLVFAVAAAFMFFVGYKTDAHSIFPNQHEVTTGSYHEPLESNVYKGEIALNDDISHFNRVFKAEFNISPGQFRAQKNEEAKD